MRSSLIACPYVTIYYAENYADSHRSCIGGQKNCRAEAEAPPQTSIHYSVEPFLRFLSMDQTRRITQGMKISPLTQIPAQVLVLMSVWTPGSSSKLHHIQLQHHLTQDLPCHRRRKTVFLSLRPVLQSLDRRQPGWLTYH
jgi:hypothetical protein